MKTHKRPVQSVRKLLVKFSAWDNGIYDIDTDNEADMKKTLCNFNSKYKPE